MIQSHNKAVILTILEKAINCSISSIQYEAIGGGSINSTYRLTVDKQTRFFCKLNEAAAFPGLFDNERKGLELLRAQQIFKIPAVIAMENTGSTQVLILEWINQEITTTQCWKSFGEKLAALHQRSSTFFGLEYDNYMGALPQSNQPSGTWIDFFIRRRLAPQVKLGIEKHVLEKEDVGHFGRLYKKIAEAFPSEPPSLVHGDLWSGNFLCDSLQQPVLIDPAVYFGHRAVDMGMTTLFGGFDRKFYEAYHYHSPLPSNHKEQWAVCNLYPLLIHLNLFGTGYRKSIREIIRPY
jgi:protein-ribulosamine 3-kinase